MKVTQILVEKQHEGSKGQLKAKAPVPQKMKAGTTKNISRDKLVGEAPFSDLGTGLKKFGAKAAAKLGAKDTAASMAGDVDKKERSNTIYRRWLSTAASANIDKNRVDAQTLANFMAKQGLPTQMLKTIDSELQDRQVQTIISKAVAQSFNPNAATPPKDATPKKAQAGDEVSVDPAMQKQLDALSPEQKKELAAML